MRTFVSTVVIGIATAWLPACLPEGDSADDGVDDLDNEVPGDEPDGESTGDPRKPRINAGVFDVGVIPDNGVGCPAGSDEIVIRMDDEDSNNGSSRTGFIGKTNFQENTSNTRFYFCKVDGAQFRPFSTSIAAADLRDDYAVLKLGTTCPAGTQEFSRRFDNEDGGNANFSTGIISPNTTSTATSDTRLFFCLFRFASPGVAIQGSFPSFGTGFRYGVFGPADFNRGALAFGRIRSDDEDDGNANSYSAPSDALLAAQRIIQPDTSVSHGATFLRVIRAR